ncbi:MAG: hypothetical protein K9M56_08710 [Victivallales bacterium]|nr:hypothetical protein [Victivallales bacterium]
MVKPVAILIIFVVCNATVLAAGSENNKGKSKLPENKPAEKFDSKMDNLENQRRMLSMKIYQLRIKLISEDTDLLMLHNQIMKLHKKLAIALNSNEKMKELLNKANNVDMEIKKLIEGKDKTATKSAKSKNFDKSSAPLHNKQKGKQ